MRRTRYFNRVLISALLAGLGATANAGAGEGAPLIKKDTRLAIVGDSITEQKIYSRYIELYLTACQSTRPEAIGQWGWSGDQAPRFARDMNHDLMFFNPTLVTTAFGMNDGKYQAYNDTIGKNYRDGMALILQTAKAAGVTVLVGGPGAVDSTIWNKKNPGLVNVYNDTLGRLSAIAKELADEHGFPFADVHGACMDAMAKAKAALGNDYVVMGKDGVHPGANGQLAMAYAFLKAMNLPADIARIEVDLGGDTPKATASDGHTVSVAGKVVKVASTRWPFCFTGATADGSTRAILPFLPFNQDLNRFMLGGANLKDEHYKLRWGETTRFVTRAELEAGINLAASFAGHTPFQEAWGQLEQLIQRKQEFETWWIKQFRARIMREFPKGPGIDADALREPLESASKALLTVHGNLTAATRAVLRPINHEIEITPIAAEEIARLKAEHEAPEFADDGYRLVYDLDLNRLGGVNNVPYAVDKAGEIKAFTRVAYTLELGKGAETQWIALELDAFTDRAELLGLPTHANKAEFQQAVKNLKIRSNADNVRKGEVAEGWMEVWPTNYGPKNVKGVANASDDVFDWGDEIRRNSNYGCFQFHLPADSQVLFAINKWVEGGADGMDIGIGNSPRGNKDYTFTSTGKLYPNKRLRVYAK